MLWIAGIAAAAACVCLYFFQVILEVLAPSLNSLNVGGSSAGAGARLKLLLFYWRGILDNSMEENLMLGGKTCGAGQAFCIGLAAAAVLLAVCWIRRKSMDRAVAETAGLLLSFFLCAFFFISRMGG